MRKPILSIVIVTVVAILFLAGTAGGCAILGLLSLPPGSECRTDGDCPQVGGTFQCLNGTCWIID